MIIPKWIGGTTRVSCDGFIIIAYDFEELIEILFSLRPLIKTTQIHI
jgi:hypothetical protein